MRASVLVGVNNEGPHREEALRFLDFLMQPEHIESYAAEQNSLSPLQGAQSGDPLFAEQLALIGEDRIYSDTDSRIPFNLLKLLNGAAAQMVRGTRWTGSWRIFPRACRPAAARNDNGENRDASLRRPLFSVRRSDPRPTPEGRRQHRRIVPPGRGGADGHAFSFAVKSAMASEILICWGQTASQLRQPRQAGGRLSSGSADRAIGARNPPSVKQCSL